MQRTSEALPRARFEALARELAAGEGVERNHLFGRPTLCIHGQLVAAYLGDCMVFRLHGPDRAYALSIPGALCWTWDPSGEQPTSSEWVEVPAGHAETWSDLAHHAVAAA